MNIATKLHYIIIIVVALSCCSQMEGNNGTGDDNEDGLIACDTSRMTEIFYKMSFGDSLTREEKKTYRDYNKLRNRSGKSDTGQVTYDSLGIKTILELGVELYKGYEGGLYPGGVNKCPGAHAEAGEEIGNKIVAIDTAGKTDTNGKVVMMALGMSNTRMEFEVFERMAEQLSVKNPKLQLVNGCYPGQTADLMACDKAPLWDILAEKLLTQDCDPRQVQVIWLKSAIRFPSAEFPEEANNLKDQYINLLQVLQRQYPNLKICYISSRTYGGYSKNKTNPEPHAFESGFAVKWLVEEQINGNMALNFDSEKGDVMTPWIAWGPYLWVDGIASSRPENRYAANYYTEDGLHPTLLGANYTANKLVQFLHGEPSAKNWFWNF